ncbi:MAG: hypothetical protein NW200_10490 [Hyphomonadaceae bacterium]|nr:hypothetical protein [Hyphomonadaceae bacterium]
MSGRTVYFELTQLGGAARMAAIDAASGVEAVVMGPANAARSDLEALALRKLERLLAAEAPPPRSQPGKLV